MKKILIFFFCIFSFSAVAMEKSTTFNKDIFTKAQSEGKIVVVSSWIKYCSSCASQMKILQNAEKDFKNIQYLAFDVKNKEISDFLNVKFQTTLLIFKNNKEVYRSIGEISKEKIYKAIESSI
jgi:thioredoxin 1|tara:strand:- start:655 stop:1023 length:369 start_codon:yes stop_codon:yes gene_type:complete